MPELDDPCAEAKALRDALRDLSMGGSVATVRFGEDMVSYAKADMATLRVLLAAAERRCLEAQGGKRQRFAMGVRFRPY